MATVRQSYHDIMLREVADRYIRDGYSVMIEPRPDELPDFLGGYRPDIVVTKPDEKIVVEVKTADRVRDQNRYRLLSDEIGKHPGWKFELVLNNKRSDELFLAKIPIYSIEELTKRLDAAEQLLSNGLPDSAILLAWSALEGALWKLSRDNGLLVPAQGPGALLSTLVSEGLVSQSAYDSLSVSLDFRNRAAHGFASETLDRNAVLTVVNLARNLLSGDEI